MERRTLVGAGLLAGLGTLSPTSALASPSSSAASPAGGAAAAGAADDDQLVAGALGELRRALQQQIDFQQGPWRAIGRVRDQQRTYLRASQKYPDFIEVGLQVWDSVYDWHVATQQPLSVARLADGRYAMTFGFSTLVLRHDLDAGHVGFGFDGDRPR
jgi:hypothetical protein